MNLTKNFTDFIDLLNKHSVEYMVVGGYAVGLHGYPRYTGDLVIWIRKAEANVDKLLLVIRDFGGPLAEISKDQFLKNATKQNPSPGIAFGREPLRIEVISSIDGVEFDNCYSRALTKKIMNTDLRYIGYEDLKTNKLATGRTKDKADIEEIEMRLKNNTI
jgi:hypothetical protein